MQLLRLNNDPQRKLLQMRKLRQHQRLLVVNFGRKHE